MTEQLHAVGFETRTIGPLVLITPVLRRIAFFARQSITTAPLLDRVILRIAAILAAHKFAYCV
jgi:hypothetical protein